MMIWLAIYTAEEKLLSTTINDTALEHTRMKLYEQVMCAFRYLLVPYDKGARPNRLRIYLVLNSPGLYS
jgi:hypothetical protein